MDVSVDGISNFYVELDSGGDWLPPKENAF